ncbi:hypothetical protein N7536_007155 [Penicillium majusculum]|uniref:Actin-like ATPase domain-containing protein n=1 Tax=Penicillium solitum TaxID=60172 RepID=A0A1V6RL99_9EURO|nr:uncharacterized protein PENSOL_c002G05937 [Penicillium solitum]KAJ5696743.1 hypothetical protein N7536_007155 [Penicillium majusculum]OQE02611.1 hypothetical protein PENSOL_c002G05937 [Penicillium solitum]
MFIRKGNPKSGEKESFLRKTSQVRNERGFRGLVGKIKKKRQSDLDDFLVIGIDFGTTYSGVAWATVEDFERDEINIISNWPEHAREEPKAPTELLYEDEKVMWGYGIPHDGDPVRWFKLLLLRDEDMTEEQRQSEPLLRARKLMRETGKTATDLVADYLRLLWEHTMETIHRFRSKSVISALTFHVVITVPAIWKDYARKAMEEAAKKAGILQARPIGPTTLTFVPEPEAAALVTLCERGREHDLETNDVYVICDAGGGTVDLITYRVGELDPIEMHEAVIGTGGLCGGIFVDEAFETLCRDRLGRQWNKLSPTGVKSILKDQWESGYKLTYKPNTDGREVIISVPAEAFQGAELTDESRKPVIKNGRIHFSSSDIQKAFTSVFADIEVLVDQQLSKTREKGLPVKQVILVGGLGCSPYLSNHLSAKYKQQGIEIIQSMGMAPRTAICRGAIVKGFLAGHGGAGSHLTVVSTIARQSLGIKHAAEYNFAIHQTEDKYYDQVEGNWMAGNQMEWYMKKGGDVSKAKPVRRDWYQCHANEEQFVKPYEMEIFQCDDENPPSRGTSKVNKLCTVHINRRHIPFNSLPDFVGKDGVRAKKWSFEIEMVPSGASNEFIVYYQGERLGSGKADVEFQ